MKVYKNLEDDISEDEIIAMKLVEKQIDYILTYQTTQGYTFEELLRCSIDDLYKIRKEVG